MNQDIIPSVDTPASCLQIPASIFNVQNLNPLVKTKDFPLNFFSEKSLESNGLEQGLHIVQPCSRKPVESIDFI